MSKTANPAPNIVLVSESKGITHLLPLLAMALILIFGVGYYAYIKRVDNINSLSKTDRDLPTRSTNPTTSWKIYTNPVYGYRFDYPQLWILNETSVDQIILASDEKLPSGSAKHYFTFSFSKEDYKELVDSLKEAIKNRTGELAPCPDSPYSGACPPEPPKEFTKKSTPYISEYYVASWTDRKWVLIPFSNSDRQGFIHLQLQYGSLPNAKTDQYLDQILSTFQFTN